MAKQPIDYEKLAENIIDFLIKSGLLRIDRREPHVITWSPNVEEQLGAYLRENSICMKQVNS